MKGLILALDSGAYSLYNSKFAATRGVKGTEKDRDMANYDYVKSAEFKNYLEGYIAYLHEHSDKLEMFVGLDIIYNHKATMEVQAYIESCGITPIPVFHYGEPFSVLRQYIDKYEYIGVGGLGQRSSVQNYIPFGDEIFKNVCDSNGQPRCKVHGFAMTSVQLMQRYPWYSCDSSTWSSLSRNGWCRFPRINKDGSYDFLRKPIAWRFTERSRHVPVHISKQSEMAKAYMQQYLHAMWGFSFDDLITEKYDGRDIANAGYSFLMGEALKDYYEERWGYREGANVYIAGHTGDRMTTQRVKRQFTIVKKALRPETPVRYLGSYFYPREMDLVFDALKPSKRRKLK